MPNAQGVVSNLVGDKALAQGETPARWPRRRLAIAVVLVVALVGSFIALVGGDKGPGGIATAQNTPPDPQLSPPYETGRPFTEPPVIRSHNGKLQVTLTAENPDTVRVSGVDIQNAQTYTAGSLTPAILGPTLRLKPGELVDLTLVNNLTRPANVMRPDELPKDDSPQPNCPPADSAHAAHAHGSPPAKRQDVTGTQNTNLHYHGLHVTTSTRHRGGDTVYGDNVLLDLAPGSVSHYRFRIPRNHDKGTFWYHAHRHECTDDQVFRGLAGVLLIGDSRSNLPSKFRNVPTRTLALKDIEAVKVDNGWAIPNDHDWRHPTQRTVNGLVRPNLEISPGETQLWRVLNVSAGLWYRIAIAGHRNGSTELDKFTIVAQDGNPQTRYLRRRTVLLGPGHRVDILVRGAGTSRVLRTLAFDQGSPPDVGPPPTFHQFDLASIRPVGDHVRTPRAPAHGGPLPHFPRRRARPRHFTFSFGHDPAHPNAFALINKKAFDPDLTKAYVRPRNHTTEKWVLINRTTEWHPIHIHQDDHRVLSVNGKRVRRPPGDQDVVALPPMSKNGRPGRVVLLMPFTIRGDFVMHCHILDHEDGGMMVPIVVR